MQSTLVQYAPLLGPTTSRRTLAETSSSHDEYKSADEDDEVLHERLAQQRDMLAAILSPAAMKVPATAATTVLEWSFDMTELAKTCMFPLVWVIDVLMARYD